MRKGYNFIYVHTHDSGREIEPYGAPAKNPSLMRLARSGLVFRNAHSISPTCSPSRAAMLTGMTPHECGMMGLAHRGFTLNDPSTHLAAYLSQNGYYTALFGVQHETQEPSTLGYTEHHTKHVIKKNPAVESDEKTLEMAKEFLREKRYGDSPFFMSFGLRATHRVYMKADEGAEDFVRPPYPIADTRETRRDYADYLKTLGVVDHCVGALLDLLEETGLSDDTVLMFTTDHGLAMPTMKANLYDSGTGVALIIKMPNGRRGVTDALVSHIDVFPTVCDILGIETPEWAQGRSMLPILKGEKEEINEYIFTEQTYHAAYEPMRSVRSRGAKLIRYYEENAPVRLPNIDQSESKEVFTSTPLHKTARPREELFDLAADPCERINLVGDERYSEIYAELSARLDLHLKETSDPILEGAVPLREGWVANLPTDRDPSDPTYNMYGERATAKVKAKGKR